MDSGRRSSTVSPVEGRVWAFTLSLKGVKKPGVRGGCSEQLQNVPEPVVGPNNGAYTQTPSPQSALYMRHSRGEQKDS